MRPPAARARRGGPAGAGRGPAGGRLPGPAAVVLLVAGGAGCARGAGTRVAFLQDWEAAKERAASEGKPIMVNFYFDS